MNKALKNPFVVGILAIVAVFVVFRSIFKKPAHYAQPPAAATQTATPGARAPAANGGTTAAARIDLQSLQRLQWGAAPARDPFRSIEPTPATPVEPSQTHPAEVSPPPADALPRLSAIWHDHAAQLAVIDGKVVAQGERIAEFLVEQILSSQVILHGTGGRTVIGFPEARKSPEQQDSTPDHGLTAGAKGNKQ